MNMIRTVLLVIGAMVAGGALWDWLEPQGPERDAPLVARKDASEPQPVRVVKPLELLDWGLSETPIAVVDTATDAMPNGLALSMVSLLVDWDRSELAGEAAHVRVRNVSVGGNPVLGKNILATVRVPLQGFTDVQWCLTPDRSRRGKDTAMGHAQLRFVFDTAARPVVLGLDGMPLRLDPHLDDLIVSWEAWRPPLTRYDPLAGLDPEAYALTVRAYGGAQRFLGDALRGNPWVCYPLALPETGDAIETLFLVSVAMGDSLMRRVLYEMVDDGLLDFSAIEDVVELTQEDIDRVAAVFAVDRVPADPMAGLLGEADLSYQLLESSCITQSFTAIQWALDRIYDEHGLGRPPTLQIVPEGLPSWTRELAHAGTAEMVARLPGALWFVASNQSVLPGRAWQVLDRAGVLERAGDGQPRSYYYHLESMTPYGAFRDNLM